MALVQFGGGVSAMAGKLGGNVFARNRAGAYARAWAMPVNAPTAVQTERRANFAAISSAWSALPEGAKEVWNGDAGGLTLKNRLGDDYTPTGRQYFMSANANLTLTGQAMIDAPPTGEVPPIIDDLATITATQVADVLDTFELNLTDFTAGSIIQIQAAPPQSTGKVNCVLLYRTILTIEADTTLDLATAFIAVFGDSFPEFAIIRLRIRAVGFETGLSSPSLIIQNAIS